MNKKAVLDHLKQTKIPLPGLIIVVVWLLTSYFLYPHAVQKPEIKGISDSKVIQTKLLPTVTPTPKINTPSPTSGAATPTVFQVNTNPSATHDIPSKTNSDTNSNTNNSNSISPTEIPSSNQSPGTDSTPTPTPLINQTNNSVTPVPTATPPSAENNAPDDNNLSTTVGTLAQSLPIGLNIPK